MIKLSSLKLNKKNPRRISADKLEGLKQSIEDFKKMLEIRPIVADEKRMVLGGTMKVKALKLLGYKEVPDEWVKFALDLTEEEKQRFIIQDNVSFGEWDFELLAENWDVEELEAWGLEMPDAEELEDFSAKNKEVNVIEFSDRMTIKLNYSEAEYHQVMKALLKIAQTPEMAVWKLIKDAKS